MDRQLLKTIDHEATVTSWIAMVGFFLASLAYFLGVEIAAFGVVAFLIVWAGCGAAAIQARRRLKS